MRFSGYKKGVNFFWFKFRFSFYFIGGNLYIVILEFFLLFLGLCRGRGGFYYSLFVYIVI